MDGTTLFAECFEKLLGLLQRMERVNSEAGLSINKSKTKIMIINRRNNNRTEIVRINDIEVVSQFVYLGALINSRECTQEIRISSAMAKENSPIYGKATISLC